METVIIAGGSGLIGKSLSSLLIRKGYSVIILTRKNIEYVPGKAVFSYAHWDPAKKIIDTNAFRSGDHIINLAGATVGEKRWTAARKSEIVNSRVQSGELIVNSLKEIPNKIKTVVNASAIGWYGTDPVIPNPHPFQEDALPDEGFLGTTCQLWEESIEPVSGLGRRLVILRTGIVLSKEGGALKEFIKPLNFGLATILGSGKQIISWIHIDDICRLYLFAIENNTLIGKFNAVAPNPVSNKELVSKLAKYNNHFSVPVKVPEFVLKTMLGEMSVEVLKSTTASAARIHATGFNFEYNTIDKALQQICE